MNNKRLTICFALLGIILISMMVLVFRAHAEGPTPPPNPYDDGSLNIDDVISLYHNNMNTEFNRYITLLMTKIPTDPKQPDDQEGKAFDATGKPLTPEQCLNDPNNYSTYCVSVNMIGGDSTACELNKTANLPLKDPDLQKFCTLGPDAFALKGFMNLASSLKKRTNKVFQTSQEQSDYINAMVCLGISSGICDEAQQKQAQVANQTQKAMEVSSNLTKIQNELVAAKNTLDQTLSAYDQLRTAWPMHLKYKEIYSLLEEYRDHLVDVRHQTDLFPSKFIDMTTTSCK